MTSPNFGAAPSYPPYGSAAPPAAPKKRGKGPVILMVIGGLILLLSIVVGTIMLVVGGVAVSGSTRAEVLPGGTGTFTAESEEVVQLYVREGTPAPACYIEGPGMATEGGADTQSTTTIDGETWTSFTSLTIPTAGEYSLDCEGIDVAVGPPVSVGGILGTLGGVLVLVFGGLLGFLVLLAGLIWLLVARRRAA